MGSRSRHGKRKSDDQQRSHELHGEAALRRQLNIANTIRWAGILAVCLVIGYFVLACTEVYMGRTAEHWILARFSEQSWWLDILLWLIDHWGWSWGIGSSSICWMKWRRNTKKTEYLAMRNQELERNIDPKRSSSKMPKDGSTRRGDL